MRYFTCFFQTKSLKLGMYFTLKTHLDSYQPHYKCSRATKRTDFYSGQYSYGQKEVYVRTSSKYIQRQTYNEIKLSTDLKQDKYSHD